jgi:hypothetical protein
MGYLPRIRLKYTNHSIEELKGHLYPLFINDLVTCALWVLVLQKLYILHEAEALLIRPYEDLISVRLAPKGTSALRVRTVQTLKGRIYKVSNFLRLRSENNEI